MGLSHSPFYWKEGSFAMIWPGVSTSAELRLCNFSQRVKWRVLHKPPYAEEITRRAVSEFRTDAERRVATMLGSTTEALGCDDPDQLGDMIGRSERTRLLAVTAMDGAVKTAWPPRVAAIGRALAAGLIATDDAVIDIEQMALGAMADMD